MKLIMTLSLLCVFLQIQAQDSQVYTESGTSFFLQVGPASNLYSTISPIQSTSFFFNDIETSKVDRSISLGIALELVRGNVAYRLQTNRVKIDETFELKNTNTDNSFGQFSSANSSLTTGFQINYEIIPGVHRYFQHNNWLFSGGIELPFTIYDIYKFSQDVKTEFSSSSGGFTFEQTNSELFEGEIPGGYDVGIGANFGLQYAFNNVLKVGILYAPSIRHYKIGGESNFTRTTSQRLFEQFENEPPFTSNTDFTMDTTNKNTQSKIAEFRQRMNFTLAFSF